MPKIDTELFDTWKNCSKEAGNRFHEFFHSGHFKPVYDERGSISGCLVTIWQNFFDPYSSKIIDEENPWIDVVIDVFHDTFHNIQRAVKACEIGADELESKFRTTFYGRVRDKWNEARKAREKLEESGKETSGFIRTKLVGWDTSIDRELQPDDPDSALLRDTLADDTAELPEDILESKETEIEVAELIAEFSDSLPKQRKNLFASLQRLHKEYPGQVTEQLVSTELNMTEGQIYTLKSHTLNMNLKDFINRKKHLDEGIRRLLIRRACEILDM